MTKLRWLVWGIALLMLCGSYWIRQGRTRLQRLQVMASQCAVIHEPKSGCPSGYTKELQPRFTEKDGSKEFACVSPDPKKDGCTDVLKGGESMEMLFRVEPPAKPDKRPRT